jgi:anti-sigma-K factor RskA
METLEHPSREDLSGYAVQALDLEDARSVELHLATCPECRAIVARYAVVSDGLLFAIPPKTPPPQLRSRLAESISAGKPVLPPAMQPRFRFSFLQTALAVTSAALLVAVILLAKQVRSLQAQEAALIQSLQTTRSEIALISQPGVTLVPLKTGQITGNLAIGPDGTTGLLLLQGLPELDDEHAFQVWLIPSSGAPQSAGLFHPPAGQPTTTFSMTAPAPIKSFSAVGVSVEPKSGSAAPTTTPILVANL